MGDKISAKKILTRILTPSAIICYNEEKTQFLWERWKTKMRLLVVEDEHSLREDIARKLRLSGYEVDACADGEAALEALAAERYDLVLLDLNLPKVDGMQVLRTLRRH
ncbi:MAG: response regulator, partial [Faecalibacterium prausnitzii]|nr:response regulator [Faecalibacterium prausnitzii]